ncbi:TOMM precursor leader peptide-binding protein [Nonomuraea typhae]|uniref:TOMM precursor leader peptide-binding protein n=1 Tax=Nonomuraea typhae TaxID=2603600 RepID=UPI0012FC4DF1|nr:TOMM precursor leader peptide-binding protein [Nonomuraea typhae]
MATAVRVTGPALVGVGDFGARVVQMMNGRAIDELDRAFKDGHEAVVAAFWRPHPRECERADELSHATGVPWLPVIMDSGTITVGPFVRPGEGPCFRCYAERRVQHDKKWISTRALNAAYDADPAGGPAGYLPHHARMAAAVATTVLERATVGSVVAIVLRQLSVSSDRVIGRHGCDRCDLARPARDLIDLLRLPEAGHG